MSSIRESFTDVKQSFKYADVSELRAGYFWVIFPDNCFSILSGLLPESAWGNLEPYTRAYFYSERKSNIYIICKIYILDHLKIRDIFMYFNIYI